MNHDDDPLDARYNSPVAAVIGGTILFLLGLAAWLALVPISFSGALSSGRSGPVTRGLLGYFLLFYTVLAGGGTALIAYKLSIKHIGAKITVGAFLAILAIGLGVWLWLGMLPNGLKTPYDLGPSPNRGHFGR